MEIYVESASAPIVINRWAEECNIPDSFFWQGALICF